MANQLYPVPSRIVDANVDASAGAKLYFYITGTTTPLTVYTTEAADVPHPSPLVANADGSLPAIWLPTGAAKCVITDASDATLATIDPVVAMAGAGSTAADIPFTPTVELPFTNVQDAIVGAAESAASGYAVFGIGITGNATLLANIDATNIGAGAARFDGTTTGTFPTGVAAADGGIVEEWRQSSGAAMMMLYHATTDRIFHRRMAASAWGTWRENITVNQGAVVGDTIYRTASAWARLAKGTAAQILAMNAGATAPEWVARATTIGILTTTGAATVGPWALPAGVTRFTVTSNKSSLSGTGHIIIQLRVAAAFVTSGYDSRSLQGTGGNLTSTAGMIVSLGLAAAFWDGAMDFWLHNPATNLWMCRHTGSGETTGADMMQGSGSIALAGAIDGIRINSTAGTFDVSSFNVHY